MNIGNVVIYGKDFNGYGTVYVAIEASFHGLNEKFFRHTLISFDVLEKVEIHSELLYIHSNRELNRVVFSQIETFCCDLKTDWHFQCISAIEEYMIKRLNVTTLHAGGVLYQDTAFIFVGERFSGKSTLIHFLCDEHDCKYIDDDNMFFRNRKFWGSALPLRLRTRPRSDEHLILQFLDERNLRRYLCELNRYDTTSHEKTIIIFPKYKEQCFEIKELYGEELFKQLLKAVRHSESNFSMFEDISFITKNIPALYIEYDYCDYVFENMKKLVGGTYG